MNKKRDIINDEIIINYVKNGVEKKVILNRFNRKKVMDELFIQKGFIFKLDIRREIEYLEMNNFSFPCYDMCFNCINSDTVVVFNNCKFRHSIEFMDGNWQLIAPYFSEDKIVIRGISVKDVNICNFNSNGALATIKMNDIGNFSFIGIGDNIIFYLTDIENILFYDVNVSKLDFNSNIYIDNFKNKNNTVLFKNSNVNVSNLCGYNLFMEQSNLYSNRKIGINLDFEFIYGRDYSIVASDGIISVNDIKRTGKLNEDNTLTDKDFTKESDFVSKVNFISLLKQISSKVYDKYHEDAIEYEKKLIANKKIKCLKKNDF